MKKKSIFSSMLVMIISSALLMTACGGSSGGSGGKTPSGEPMNLEEYAKSNSEVQKSIDEATSDSDVEVEIKGNEVIYSFELSKMEGFNEDVATDPSVIESLQAALDNAGSTFGGIAKTLEEATQISGIKVTVKYTFNDDVLATKTFDSSDAVEAGSGKEKLPAPTEPEEGSSSEEAPTEESAESE